jgi:hypothetical protein
MEPEYTSSPKEGGGGGGGSDEGCADEAEEAEEADEAGADDDAEEDVAEAEIAEVAEFRAPFAAASASFFSISASSFANCSLICASIFFLREIGEKN